MSSLFGSGLWFFFLAGAGANLLFTPLAIHFSRRLGVLDHPGHRKVHTTPVPKLGGAALMLSVLGAAALGYLFTLVSPAFPLDLNRLAKASVILGTTFLAALLGLADDLYHLKPRWKLLGQAFFGLVFAGLGYHFQVLHLPGFHPFNLSFLGIPLTALWIMAVVNGFNFMDGVDGLAGSVTLSILGGIGVLAGLEGNLTVEALSAALLGAVLVFLAFNWRPAKVFMGDCGANLLGAFCAASLASLGQGGQAPWLFSLGASQADEVEPFRFQAIVVTLLVGYPILEVTLSTFRRAIRSFLFGRSMEWSEKEHIHHRLLKMGMGAGAICLVAVVFNSALSAAGLLAMVRQNALGVLCAAPVILFLAAIMPRMGFFDFLDLRNIRRHQPHYQIAHHFIAMQGIKLRLAAGQDEVLALVNQTTKELGVQGYRLMVKSDGEGHGGCHVSWERPLDEHREYLSHLRKELVEGEIRQFKDKVVLGSGQGEASWIFEPVTEETELDMEYRILVSEFMREAIARIALLPTGTRPDNIVDLNKAAADTRVRSSLLRRRHSPKGKG